MNVQHQALKHVISVTPSFYETLYAPLPLNLKTYFEKINPDVSFEAKKILLMQTWQHAIDALKIHRGYMFSLSKDAEICYKEQEIGVYAVFTAMLGKAMMVNTDYSLETVMKALLPDRGMQWLTQHDAIFAIWQNYVSGKSQTTVFNALEAHLKKKEPCVPTPVVTETSLQAENQLHTVSSSHEETPDTHKIKLDEKKPLATIEKIAEAFLPWLKQQIQEGNLVCNRKDDLLYRVEAGILCIAPAILIHFQKQSHLCPAQQLKNIPFKKALSRSILQTLPWIKNHDDHYLHLYFRGDWQNKQVVKGFLLPIDCLWGIDKNQWPVICPHLQPDIRLDKPLNVLKG